MQYSHLFVTALFLFLVSEAANTDVSTSSLTQTTTSLKAAADAVISGLRTRFPGQVTLKSIKSDTLQVFCGDNIKINLNLGENTYDMFMDRPGHWKNLEVPAIKDNVEDGASKDFPNSLNPSECILSPVHLEGPLSIELTIPSNIKFVTPPEAVSFSKVKKIIIDDRALIKLKNAKHLHLKDSVELAELPQEYIDFVFGSQRSAENAKYARSPYGVMHLSSQLREMSRRKNSNILMLELEASSTHDIVIERMSKNPLDAFIALEKNGVINIMPKYDVDENKRSAVKVPWAWPFPDLKGEHLFSAEDALKNLFANHWPKFNPTISKMQLNESSMSSLMMIRFDMEVEMAIPMPIEGYSNSSRYTMLFDASILVDGSHSKNKYIPLEIVQKDVEESTVTFSQQAKYLASNNHTLQRDNYLFDYNL